MLEKEYTIETLDELDYLSNLILKKIYKGSIIYLSGDLGVGKTAFVKSFIKNAGFFGNVTSPTYSIMQDYETDNFKVIHCDLYRISEPEEVLDIGIFDIVFESGAVLLLEWPEKASPVLKKPDIHINISLYTKPFERRVFRVCFTKG